MKQNTVFINLDELSKEDKNKEVKKIIEKVYSALKEKGYNPVGQFAGYLLSGDPSYITSYNGARGLITKVARDEIIEVLLDKYLN